MQSADRDLDLDQPATPERRVSASARSTLFSILGEFVYADGRPVWTSSLLYVLTGAGFSEEAARQAVARGAAAGWITGERHGRETRWSLTAATRRMFDLGTERVFAFSADPRPWDGRWLIVVISVPHAHRGARKRLYSSLHWAGLGNPAPGLWLTPHADRVDEVQRTIDALELSGFAVSAIGEPGQLGMSVDEIVRRAWDLQTVAASYGELLERFGGYRPAGGDGVLQAMLELTDEIRRLPFMDPQLPQELSPDWIGRQATVRLRELRASWYGEAHERWREIVEESSRR
jgi:phenylacetic acid degradation operon negative regulatory protein